MGGSLLPQREVRRCTQCILPENYPGIEFNEMGVCNYCLDFKKREYRGREELDRLLGALRREDGDFDCVVGISGGRDSAYALWYLAKELNLRVLAFTADNGFIPDVARANMKSMTDILGVELVIGEHDFLKRCVKHNVSAVLRKPVAQMVQMMCCGCRLGIVRGLFECARRHQIPLIVVGGGTPVEICYYKRAFFGTNLFRVRGVPVVYPLLVLLALSYEMIRNPSFLTPTGLSVYLAEYLYYFAAGIRERVYPKQQILRLYHYIEWDEDRILSTIKKELGWRRGRDSASSWRADCKISHLKNYVLGASFGFTEKDDYFSNMIRENMITREEALKRRREEALVPQDVITELCDEIGISPADLGAAVERAREKALEEE
jgi:hypothetical protein